MTKHAMAGGVAALVLLISTPLMAQDRAAQHRGFAGPEMILQHQEALGLTGDQVAELRTIAAELRERNAPLREQLRELRGERGWDGRARDGDARQRATRARERATAMRERMRDMSAEERREMRERMRAERGERGERQGMRGERGQRPAGVRGARELPEELRAAMQEASANRRAALERARSVLTEAQSAQLREIVREHRPQRGQRRGASEAGPRR